ncbi:MAG: ATP:cob(I)alamin adenosyltransferase [Polyangiaceae bacterium]
MSRAKRPAREVGKGEPERARTPTMTLPPATHHEGAPTVRSALEPLAANGPFADPRVAINRVYTKKGDQGRTSLVGGQKVDKDDLRIEAYGTVDELNAIVGAARQSAIEALDRRERTKSGAGRGPSASAQKSTLLALAEALLRVQHELFNLGSLLATLPEDLHPKQPRVTDIEVVTLEREMDSANANLEPLRSFVLPGGSRLNTDLHLARTVCRRAERCVVRLAHATAPSTPGDALVAEPIGIAVRYLNRLSDAFFVWSRLATVAEGADEILWTPNRAASGEGSG